MQQTFIEVSWEEVRALAQWNKNQQTLTAELSKKYDERWRELSVLVGPVCTVANSLDGLAR